MPGVRGAGGAAVGSVPGTCTRARARAPLLRLRSRDNAIERDIVNICLSICGNRLRLGDQCSYERRTEALSWSRKRSVAAQTRWSILAISVRLRYVRYRTVLDGLKLRP